MINTRKKLIAEIAKLNKTLHYQQNQVIKRKKYFIEIMNSYKAVFFAILLPSFFLGWRIGKGRWVGQMLKQLIELGMFAAVSHYKKQLIRVFLNNKT